MSRRLMAVGLAAMLASAAAAAERTWHRAYDVAPGAVLRLTSYRGAVTITESDRPVIDLTVRARTYGASAERAAWLLAGVEFHATHTPQGVDLEVTNPRERRALRVE